MLKMTSEKEDRNKIVWTRVSLYCFYIYY